MASEWIDPQVQALQARVAELEQENDFLKEGLRQCLRREESRSQTAADAESRQDPLLSTVAQVANLLLRSQDYTMVLPDVVRLLGEAVGSDRCGIGQNIIHLSLDKVAVKTPPEWEWCKTEIRPTEEYSPYLNQLYLWEEDAPYLDATLVQGEVINCLVADLPEPDRSLLAAQGNTAKLFVPILVNYQLWGFIAFDNCKELRLYDEAEIAILQIAADSLAAAIERQAKGEELLKLEQERTRSAAERSQELERLNTELQQTLDRLTESEERYRTLFEISSEGIYRFEHRPPISVTLPVDQQADLIHQNCYIAEGNQTYAEMYDLRSSEDFTGNWLRDFHAQSSEQNQIFLQTVAANNHRIRNYESEEVDFIGKPRYFLNNITTILKDGYAIGGWASQLDITELRLAQQALLQAEQDRVAELAKTNQALKNSLDRLAADPNLNAFLGHVLQVIAEQFDSPLVEHWIHPELEDAAYINLTCWQGQILTPQQQPAHPGNLGLPITSDPSYEATLRLQHYLIYQGVGSAQDTLGQHMTAILGIDVGDWYVRRGVNQFVDVPLILGEAIIGILSIWFPEHRTFSPQNIELAQALAQQATLAIQLTRLADEAQEAALLEERNRMAGEIHDTLAQAFTGIVMQLQASERLLHTNPTQAQTCLDRAQTLAKSGLVEARRSVWALYTDIDEDLFQRLSAIVHSLTDDTGVAVQTILEGTPYPP
jgi:signal transduction histidine kinase/PAS domain-containing protein